MRVLTAVLFLCFLVNCIRKEVGEIMKPDITELAPLLDEDYLKARDKILADHDWTQDKNPSSLASAPPDIRGALVLRASQPEKAKKFTEALTGENLEFLNPQSQAKIPTQKQIASYLNGFGIEYMPLAEEYLFKSPAKFRSNAVGGAALYLLKCDSERAKMVAVASFAKFAGKDTAQLELIEAVHQVSGVLARDALWQAYSTTKLALLRYACRHMLARFLDKEMKIEIETLLASDKVNPTDRERAAIAYLFYLPGSDFEKCLSAYHKFKLPASRKQFARLLSPYTESEAKTLSALIKETVDGEIKSELEGNLLHYQSLSPASEN